MEDCQLRDYQGDYEIFLEQNETEAEVMEEKEERRRELEKTQIKAKSKVCLHVALSWAVALCSEVHASWLSESA